MKLSIVSPVYNTAEYLQSLSEQLVEATNSITEALEIIYVDDNSPDNSWEILKELSQKHPTIIKSIKLSKNVGQDLAITAGIEHSTGDIVIVMDSDLQDDPVFIPDLVKKYREGYDIVFTLKKERQHPFLKNIFARLFHRVVNLMVDDKRLASNSKVGSYSLLSAKAIKAYKRINDYQRHYLMILKLLGFKRGYVKIEHRKRVSGKSAYNFKKLSKITMDSFVMYSSKLIKMAVVFSLFQVLITIFFIGGVIIGWIIHGFSPGWASIICAILLTTSILDLMLCIIGLYLLKVFDQVKNRPLYFVDESFNLERSV